MEVSDTEVCPLSITLWFLKCGEGLGAGTGMGVRVSNKYFLNQKILIFLYFSMKTCCCGNSLLTASLRHF